MTRVPARLFNFGRTAASRAGALVRPAVPFALGAGALTLGGGYLIDQATAFRKAGQPLPLQVVPVDLDPSRPGPESVLAYDRVTGGSLTFGQPPVHQGEPERSQERSYNTTVIAAGAVILGVAALVVFGRGK